MRPAIPAWLILMDAPAILGKLLTEPGVCAMKTKFVLVALCLGTISTVWADPATIAKQRAKETVRQNNVRQGVGAPAAPATVSPGAAVKPAADPVAKLRTDIAAIAKAPSVAPELKKEFTTDLMACARGSRKPTLATVEKFAHSLSAALAGKGIESTVQARLAQDINLMMNSASLSATRTGEVGDDVQAILQTSGLNRGTAVNIAEELKAIAAELQAAK